MGDWRAPSWRFPRGAAHRLQWRELSLASCALVFVAAAWGCLCCPGSGEQGCLCSWIPQDGNHQRDSFWEATTARVPLKLSQPSASVKKTRLLVLKLLREGRASALAHVWGPDDGPDLRLSGCHGTLWALTISSLRLTGVSHPGAYTLIGAPICVLPLGGRL